MDNLLTLSGTRLAALIARREVSSREVVDLHIRHIERVNPRINALVHDRFEQACAEADAADARVRGAATSLPAFHGVPCTIKESFSVAGMPNTSGLVARRGVVSREDAVTVARLRSAGAIPLGVTNVSELCMWMETNNRVYGRTNNPYDPRRIAGGSSGGEGAIVGAGGVPFGLGADIGGSIRMPAFFNGVFGHKPTGGLVPNDGQYPLPAEAALRYVATGPLARRAEDLAPLVRILAGSDDAVGDPPRVDVREIDVLVVEDDGVTPVTADLRRAQAAAADALRDRGARVRPAKIPLLSRTIEVWSAMLDAAGGPSFASMLGEGTPIATWRELARWVVRRSPHTLPALGLALFETLPKRWPERAAPAIAIGGRLRDELANQLGSRGVMLYPPYASAAPRHYRPMFPPTYWVYTAVFNVMEMPSTAVPLGLDAAGVPLGVQVAARSGNDELTIAVALELERAFGGWHPPPLSSA